MSQLPTYKATTKDQKSHAGTYYYLFSPNMIEFPPIDRNADHHGIIEERITGYTSFICVCVNKLRNGAVIEKDATTYDKHHSKSFYWNPDTFILEKASASEIAWLEACNKVEGLVEQPKELMYPIY